MVSCNKWNFSRATNDERLETVCVTVFISVIVQNMFEVRSSKFEVMCEVCFDGTDVSVKSIEIRFNKLCTNPT